MKKLLSILLISGITGTSSSNITSCSFNNKSAITKNLDNFNNFKDKTLILEPSADYNQVFNFIYQQLSNYTHMSVEAIKSDPYLKFSLKSPSGEVIQFPSTDIAELGFYQKLTFTIESGSEFKAKDNIKTIQNPFKVKKNLDDFQLSDIKIPKILAIREMLFTKLLLAIDIYSHAVLVAMDDKNIIINVTSSDGNFSNKDDAPSLKTPIKAKKVEILISLKTSDKNFVLTKPLNLLTNIVIT